MQALGKGATLLHGTYRIEKVLGQGGFGITYLATDVNLDRKVAIITKAMSPGWRDRYSSVNAFLSDITTDNDSTDTSEDDTVTEINLDSEPDPQPTPASQPQHEPSPVQEPYYDEKPDEEHRSKKKLVSDQGAAVIATILTCV